MLVRPATPDDVLRVGRGMWWRGKEELGWLRVTELQWLEGWRRRIRRGDAFAIGDVAILGCDWESHGVCATAFQATTDFELPGVGRQATKAMRKSIPDLMKKVGARKACVYSLCVDQAAPKWFRLLGFEEDTDYTGLMYGPYKSRRFVRRV
jgi:hypothetical protein